MKFKHSCYALLTMLLFMYSPSHADERDVRAFEIRCQTNIDRNLEPTLALLPSKFPFFYKRLKAYMAELKPDNYEYTLPMIKQSFKQFLESRIENDYRKNDFMGDFGGVNFCAEL